MTIAKKLNELKTSEIEQIIKNAGLATPDRWGWAAVYHGLLKLVPTSTYVNDSMGTDSSLEQRAYLLDVNGAILGEVRSGYTSRLSDGSERKGQGQSVQEALDQLEENTAKAAYVLLEETKEEEDNTKTIKKCDGAEIRGKVTLKKRELMLYEIKK